MNHPYASQRADSAMYPGWPQGADLTGELMKVLHVPGSD